MDFENLRIRILFWLAWTLANSIGLALGWAIGETLGQAVGQTTSWFLGQTVAWVVLEAIVWVLRGVIIHYFQDFNVWKPIDTGIWLVTEAGGWLIGEGFRTVAGPVWVTAGAIWGLTMGAAMWIIIWFIKQPKRGSAWWAIAAACWTFFGIIGGSMLVSLGIVTSMEWGEMVGKLTHPAFGWGMSGLILGGYIGGITGIVFVRLLRRPISDKNSAVVIM